MALDRTWYNTLVDDDGSGLTGSVWDKADVNSLMTAVDNELGRIDAPDSCSVSANTITTGVPSGAWTAVQFDLLHWQTSAGMFVSPSNQIVMPRTGYYLVTGVVTFPQGDGIRGISIFANGAAAPGLGGQQVLQVATQATYNILKTQAIIYMGPGVYVQLAVFQNTAGGITIGGLHIQTTNHLQVHRLK